MQEEPRAFLEGTSLLRRLPTLADAAVFSASERAGATTGTVLNLTSGTVVD